MARGAWVGAALAGALLSAFPAAASAAVPVHVRVVDACRCGIGDTLTLTVGGRVVAQGLRWQGVSNYTEIGAGSQNIQVTGARTATLDADLAPGGYYTLVMTGETDDPLLVVRETGGGSEPAAGVLHVVRTGAFSTPVQLVLDHGLRITAMLPPDRAAPAVTVTPGTHELDLYSLPGVLLGRVAVQVSAGKQATVVLAGSPGGSPDLTVITATGPQVAAVWPTAAASAAAGAPSTAAVSQAPATVTTSASTASTASQTPVLRAASTPAPAAAGTLPKTGGGPLALVWGLLSMGGGAALIRRRVLP